MFPNPVVCMYVVLYILSVKLKNNGRLQKLLNMCLYFEEGF